MSIQQPYPRQPQEGIPGPPFRKRILRRALTGVAAVAVLAGMVGLFFGLLYAINPVGDEWICSEGEAPATGPGNYSSCFRTDESLPPGVEWDPFGNRPMSYNCDKDGWVLIERPSGVGGAGNAEEDCVREGTELPGGWRLAERE